MRNTFFVSCILTLMLLLCACDTGETASGDAPNPDFGAEKPQEEKPDVPNPYDPENSDLPRTRMKEENICRLDETVDCEGFAFANFRLEKGKALPADVTPDMLHYEGGTYAGGEKKDEEGRLTREYSYVFISAEITNGADAERTVYLNANNFILLDENLTYASKVGREIYRSNADAQGTDAYYAQHFEPGETASVTLGYVLKDEYADAENLYFLLDPLNSGLEDLKAVAVGEEGEHA